MWIVRYLYSTLSSFVVQFKKEKRQNRIETVITIPNSHVNIHIKYKHFYIYELYIYTLCSIL